MDTRDLTLSLLLAISPCSSLASASAPRPVTLSAREIAKEATSLSVGFCETEDPEVLLQVILNQNDGEIQYN